MKGKIVKQATVVLVLDYEKGRIVQQVIEVHVLDYKKGRIEPAGYCSSYARL